VDKLYFNWPILLFTCCYGMNTTTVMLWLHCGSSIHLIAAT